MIACIFLSLARSRYCQLVISGGEVVTQAQWWLKTARTNNSQMPPLTDITDPPQIHQPPLFFHSPSLSLSFTADNLRISSHSTPLPFNNCSPPDHIWNGTNEARKIFSARQSIYSLWHLPPVLTHLKEPFLLTKGSKGDKLDLPVPARRMNEISRHKTDFDVTVMYLYSEL